jgi:hypothetical protein
MTDASATITDCLVLKLEEKNEHGNLSKHVIYVLYDVEKRSYVVRGQNIQSAWTKHRAEDYPYSFISKDVYSLADYILYVISKHNNVKEVLYNFADLPEDSNDITFEYLKDSELEDYEVSYNPNNKLCKKKLVSTLKILRNVFNYYK